MRSSIVSTIQSVLEFRFICAILWSSRAIPVIFQIISILPIGANNAFVTAYLLESSLARFKKMSCAVFKLFRACQALKRETNWSPQKLVYFLPCEREREVHKCIHPKHFRVSGIKISNVVTKETSQMLLQTLWHLRKPQINLVSLWGNSFTEVLYNIGQVETPLGCINRYRCVFWIGLLLTPTVAT